MKRIVLLTLLVVFLACPREASAVITLDTSAQSAVSSADPVTLSFTCGAGARLLIVSVGGGKNAARGGGPLTYNGVTMTQAGSSQVGANESNAEIWYMIDPPTGQALTISAPNPGGGTDAILMASSWKTTGDSFDFEAATGTSVSGANPSLAISTRMASLVIDSFSDGNNNVPTANNQTLLFSVDLGNSSSNVQYALQTTAGSTTMSWTVGNDDVAFAVAAFRESFGTKITEGFITDSSLINGQ